MSASRTPRALLAGFCLLALGARLPAQRSAPTVRFESRALSAELDSLPLPAIAGLGRGEPPDLPPRHTPWAVLASAALPGSGQAMLRQSRFIAYVAFEGYAWARYVADRREGMRQRDRYRMLARRVAREMFESSPRNGDWAYYEQMEKFAESGVFDRSPGGDLEPEVDTTTYNGKQWLLARETFWSNPNQAPDRASREWRLAEDFYRGRAVGPAYRWSWRNALLEYDEFRRTIRRSNDGFRRSLEDLGVIIANHALSTVDAFVTVRVRQQPGSTRRASGYAVTLSVPFDGPR
jgi:hypothetical protein